MRSLVALLAVSFACAGALADLTINLPDFTVNSTTPFNYNAPVATGQTVYGVGFTGTHTGTNAAWPSDNDLTITAPDGTNTLWDPLSSIGTSTPTLVSVGSPYMYAPAGKPSGPNWNFLFQSTWSGNSAWTGNTITLNTSAPGNATVYEEEANFLGALASPYYLDDFNGFTYGGITTPTWDSPVVNGYSYQVSAVGGSGNLYSSTGAHSVDSAAALLKVTMTGAPVKAVGGWFYGGDVNGAFVPATVTVALQNGFSYTFSPANDTDFVGFVADSAIASLTIDAGPDTPSPLWPTLDHFYVGNPVPEPASLALLAVAALIRRR